MTDKHTPNDTITALTYVAYFADTHPDLGVEGWGAGLWQGTVRHDEAGVTMDLLAGAEPGTVTHTARGPVRHLERDYGAGVKLILHLPSLVDPDPETVVTVLNEQPALPLDAS